LFSIVKIDIINAEIEFVNGRFFHINQHQMSEKETTASKSMFLYYNKVMEFNALIQIVC